MSFNNTTGVTPFVDHGPYYMQYGAERIFDALYLTILTVVGTFGNLLVILSIAYAGRVNKNGNIFIINLAIADLIVTGLYLPTIIANVVVTTNALTEKGCQALAYLATVSCACSASNLACIAFNRYWCMVRHKSYSRIFTAKLLFIAAALNWVWVNFLVMPSVLGWSRLGYEHNMMICTYYDDLSRGYNIFLISLGIGLPISVTVVCYWRLFAYVSKRRANMKRHREASPTFSRGAEQRKLQKQLDLAKTLSVTVLAFVLCLSPYGITILLHLENLNPLVKKITIRLVFTNSAVNFVIYGVLNPTYRKGYIALFRYVHGRLKCRKQNGFCFKSTNPGVDSNGDTSANGAVGQSSKEHKTSSAVVK